MSGNIWICNTDVESEWAQPGPGTSPASAEHRAIFHHFEEILLSSINPNDIAILRAKPNALFLKYLKGLGFDLPEYLVVQGGKKNPLLSTTDLVLGDASLIADLKDRVRSKSATNLECFGVSKQIEKIARGTGLHLPYVDSEMAAFISRKSSGRNLAKKLGLKALDGEICDDPKKIVQIARAISSRGGGCPVVIKPDLGASGRGQRIIRSQEDFEALEAAIERGEFGVPDTTHVLERWHEDSVTFMYDFTIDRLGRRRPSSPIILRKGLEGTPGIQFGYKFRSILGLMFRNPSK